MVDKTLEQGSTDTNELKTDSKPSQSKKMPSIKIFISHRHDDSAVAQVIADTIISWGSPYGKGKELENQIHISSSPRSGTKFGENIKSDLVKKIGETELLILVYTAKNKDWTWCTYEFGVHTNPPSVKIGHGSKKIIYQCLSDTVPEALKAGRVVKISEDDIYKFTKEYFESDNFFPDRSAYSPNMPESALKSLAGEFYKKLKDALPSQEDKKTIPLISIAELMEKERLISKGGVLKDPATVIVRRAQPLETNYEVAGRVMSNIDCKVSYRYYFDCDEDLADVCRLIQTLAISGINELRDVSNREIKMEKFSDDIKNNLEKIKNNIIISFLDNKKGVRKGPEEFCVLNATNKELASYYLSYKLDKNDAFVKLYETDKAKDCIKWLEEYTKDIEDTNYVFHSTNAVDIYEVNLFRKKLNAKVKANFPGELFKKSIDVFFKDGS